MEVNLLTFSRVVAFIVGLLSLILGTATLMLGLSLDRNDIIHIGMALYTLSVSGVGWWFVSRRWVRPQ